MQTLDYNRLNLFQLRKLIRCLILRQIHPLQACVNRLGNTYVSVCHMNAHIVWGPQNSRDNHTLKINALHSLWASENFPAGW